MKPIREEPISSSPVMLIDEVILRAYSEHASDIHIEPAEHECRVRIRIDGDLTHVGIYKKEIHEEAVARLKVLSQLRTDVRTIPQDGRFKVNISNTGGINIRLSVIPTHYGEKCVLRLLPNSLHTHTLESLGFSTVDSVKIAEAIKTPHGLILVVGPTGSGKTTTLYTLLQMVAKPDVSAVTLEDPIEYALSGVTQIPIHSGQNSMMTYSNALRAVVRQDPDIIMVGEIRDSATAGLSIHSALTGHLMFSTLHTNDAVTAIPRLIDLGIEPFLISSTLRAVISQRLVRKLCQKCKKERHMSVTEVEYLNRIQDKENNKPEKTSIPGGCAECKNSGFRGRTVVAEVLMINEEIKSLINHRASSAELTKAASKNMTVVALGAVQKVLIGMTTFEEVASMCHQEI